jgi:hypothetical protein
MGKKAYAEQMELYSQGIPFELQETQELYSVLTKLHYPAIKNVWMGDDGCVVVQGQKRKHYFYMENGMAKIRYNYRTDLIHSGILRSLKQMSIHKDVAAVAEANQIMDALAIDQQIPLEQKQRGYGKIGTGVKILIPAFITIILGGILLCVGISKGMDDEKIQYVKNKYLSDTVNATYDEIFNFYLTEPKWDYFESNQNKCIVEVSGESSDGNNQIVVQFVFVGSSSSDSITSSTPIDIAYMEVNGKTCTSDEAIENMEAILQMYVEKENLTE